jgi:hypothetical protein
MTVRELGHRMDAHEVGEWQAYFRLHAEEDRAPRSSSPPRSTRAVRPPAGAAFEAFLEARVRG